MLRWCVDGDGDGEGADAGGTPDEVQLLAATRAAQPTAVSQRITQS
ncbi:MAG TPA: hypothetical protein VGH43_14690 [Jatrophihabitans sp.]